jgi:hypothetical protein
MPRAFDGDPPWFGELVERPSLIKSMFIPGRRRTGHNVCQAGMKFIATPLMQ